MLSITPDQLSAAGSYIARNWSPDGYRIENVTAPIRHVTLFHVVASDGSRFVVAADTWGNCQHMSHADHEPTERTGVLIDLVREMHAKACTA